MVLAIEEIIEHLLALGIADALQDDLLGRLRTDATEIDRLERFLDELLELHVGNLRLRVGQTDLLLLRPRAASSGTTSQRRKDSYSPVSRSMVTRTSASSCVRFLVAEASADLQRAKHDVRATFFSRARASTSNSNSRLM
jgi:hypothetical protein